jgi:hypothetical protein
MTVRVVRMVLIWYAFDTYLVRMQYAFGTNRHRSEAKPDQSFILLSASLSTVKSVAALPSESWVVQRPQSVQKFPVLSSLQVLHAAPAPATRALRSPTARSDGACRATTAAGTTPASSGCARSS